MTKRIAALVGVWGILVWMGAAPASAQQLADPKTITAANASCLTSNCVEVATRGVPSVGIDVSGSGTFTLVVEGTRNGGTTWRTINVIDDSDQDALASSIAAAGSFAVPNSGYTAIRVRASALTDGTPVVTLTRGVLAPLDALGGGGGGGGSNTEYLEAATDASIAGIAAMMEVAGDALRPVQGSVTDGLLVNLGANNDVTVTGSVTANAGTNLNTSALALESGGNLAAMATSLGTLDNTVAGTELQVDVVTMPTTTVTATDLDVQSGGADILSTTAFNAAFGTAGASDTQVLSVQGIASGTALPISGSISCSNCSGSGASDVDDSSFTIATDSVAPAGYLFDDVTPDSVNEGDVGLARMSANRVPFATIRDAAGNERGVNVTAGNALTVDGSGVTQPVSGTITANLSATDNAVLDDIADGIAVTNAGTFAVQCSNCSGSGASDVDDSSFTVGSDSVAPLGLLVDETTPDSADEGDSAVVRGSPNRNLYTQIRDGASGAERGVAVTANNELLVELGAGSAAIGTVTVTDGAGALNVIVDSGALTVSATNLDVQSGGADLATEATLAGVLTSTNFAAAFGTAGTADSQVLSVQGVASMTPLTVTATNLDVQIGGSDTLQVQSNSANLATQTTAAAIQTAVENLATYLQPGSGVLIRSDGTDNDDETQIKGTAGVLLAISGRNSSTDTHAFVRCTNATAASTTPGSTTVVYEMMLPFGGGFVQASLGPAGFTFTTALTCYLATGEAVSSTVDPAADKVVVTVIYR